jgi:hypothetical protein
VEGLSFGEHFHSAREAECSLSEGTLQSVGELSAKRQKGVVARVIQRW